MEEDLEEVLRRKDDGALSWICAVCSELGELVYCDLCKKGFHIDEQCLGSTEAPDDDEWVCSDCREAKVDCFACKQTGSTAPGGDIVVCSRRDCAKFFHEACLEDLEGVTWGGPNGDHLICPQHSCRACNDIMRASKLYKCLLCPVAYHEQCAPDGSHLLEEIPSHCICWRHESDWKRQPKKLPSTRDIIEVFERLAVPLVEIDFELPPEVRAGDSDDEMDMLHPEPVSSSVQEATPEGVPEITKEVDTGCRKESAKPEVSGNKRGLKERGLGKEGEDLPSTKRTKRQGLEVREEAGSSDGHDGGAGALRNVERRDPQSSTQDRTREPDANGDMHSDASKKQEKPPYAHIDQSVWLVRRRPALLAPQAGLQAAPPFSPAKKLELHKDQDSEWSVGAAEDVAAQEFLVEFVGEVVDAVLCHQRISALERRGAHNLHLCQLDDSLILDAYYKGNLSRFIAHSTQPNCQLQRWRVAGELRVGVFATEAIKKGDPLSYDYKAVPFGSHALDAFPLRIPTACDQPSPPTAIPRKMSKAAFPEKHTVKPPPTLPETAPEGGVLPIKPEADGEPKPHNFPSTTDKDLLEKPSSHSHLDREKKATLDGLTVHASISLADPFGWQRLGPPEVAEPASAAPQKGGFTLAAEQDTDQKQGVALAPERGPLGGNRGRPVGERLEEGESAEVGKDERPMEESKGRGGGTPGRSREQRIRRSVDREKGRERRHRGERDIGDTPPGGREVRGAREKGESPSPGGRELRRRGEEERGRKEGHEGRARRGEEERRRSRVSLRGVGDRKQTPGEERLERRERLKRAQEDSPRTGSLARELRRLGAEEEKVPSRGASARLLGSAERGGERRRAPLEADGGDKRLPSKKRGRPPSKKTIEPKDSDSARGGKESNDRGSDDEPSAAPTPVSPPPARPSSSHTAQSSPHPEVPLQFAAPPQPVVSASIATSPVPGEMRGGREVEERPPEQEPSGTGALAAAESAAVGGAKVGRHDDHEEAASPHNPWRREGPPRRGVPWEDDGEDEDARGRSNGRGEGEREENGRRNPDVLRKPRKVPKWGGRRSRYWVPGYPLNWTAASYLQQHNQLPQPPIEA